MPPPYRLGFEMVGLSRPRDAVNWEKDEPWITRINTDKARFRTPPLCLCAISPWRDSSLRFFAIFARFPLNHSAAEMTTIYLATGNPHKARELSEMTGLENLALGIALAHELGGMPEVEENADTFRGNATLKARALVDRIGQNDFVLADDSGLEVDALKGGPGIHSARYAGAKATDEDNLNKLLAALRGVGEDDRGAQFTCCLILADAAGRFWEFSGVCRGRIITRHLGRAGFGYDPVFVPDGYDRTFAQLGDAVKSRISHRARAMAKLVNWLKAR